MTIQTYIDTINQRFSLGNATEHTFRGDLQQLIENIVPTITATNEPKRQICGSPDYIITQKGKEIPIGFIEAKDLGDKDLEGSKKNGNKEQFDRYKTSLDNIIFTDYLRFYFYQNQTLIAKVEIGEIVLNQVVALPENFKSFEQQLKDFCTYAGQTIDNSTKLAQMMAVKARLLAEVIEKSLVFDIENNEESTLKEQLESFREILIHDVTPKDFADVYAQTIAYGMFAARYHDTSLDTFSREEAYKLIPKSNPFLKNLFGYIAGDDLDDRIKWIVDSLVEIFLATDIAKILKNFGKSTQTEDPIIHFYETFLTEYDVNLRKNRGVWYTPQPVVNFIVRAVDEILKTEFELKDGLADSSKIYDIHKVQILDPATGTGTFLAEIIRHIYQKFEGQQGAWANYVENNLLPRLNGFELLMASYAMAHLKMDMILTETGFQFSKNQRFRIFLTNSLEEYHSDTYKLPFATWLSNEANEANRIKRDTPVMCIIGNPPYSGESANQLQWIDNLMKDYKKEPNTDEKLNERNPKWINDDYVKFIRYGQYLIEKNGSGVLAFINPHGFLDNPTFRGMRWNLLKTYDKIYTLDLHGNARKHESSPDGSQDQNVFNIMQGVSINIFVKTGKKQPKELGKVFHFDLYGKRNVKFDFLNTNSLKTVDYKELENIAPNYFFVPKNDQGKDVYEKGFAVKDLFLLNNVGIVTSRDSFAISMDINVLVNRINDFYNKEKSNYDLIKKYKIKETNEWKLDKNRIGTFNPNRVVKIDYRFFDTRYIYYSNNIIDRDRKNVMQHLTQPNIALILSKQQSSSTFRHVFLSKNIQEMCLISLQTKEGGYTFPLYLYPEGEDDKSEYRENLKLQLEEAKVIFEDFQKTFSKIKKMYINATHPDKDVQQFYKEQEKHYKKLLVNVEKLKQQLETSTGKMFEDEGRKPNLNMTIVNQIAKNLNLNFIPEKIHNSSFIIHHSFSPIDILDYVYAVLYSPTYRENYKEFLKIDFPRVPYPTDTKTFWQFVKLGGELRQIHLLESEILDSISTTYPVAGDNVIQSISFNDGKVYINETQYFEHVPQMAWDFFIGGYQPAQKWLKDRKDRALNVEEILHYQKIITALVETDRIMKEIK